jgi:hypothetical protein
MIGNSRDISTDTWLHESLYRSISLPYLFPWPLPTPSTTSLLPLTWSTNSSPRHEILTSIAPCSSPRPSLPLDYFIWQHPGAGADGVVGGHNGDVESVAGSHHPRCHDSWYGVASPALRHRTGPPGARPPRSYPTPAFSLHSLHVAVPGRGGRWCCRWMRQGRTQRGCWFDGLRSPSSVSW